MAGKRLRSGVVKPRRPGHICTCYRWQRMAQNRAALFEAINGFYAAALDRLPVEEMPTLIPRLLKGGLCVGFSDPVSNIILNTISYKRVAPELRSVTGSGSGSKVADRRRWNTLSQIIVDITNVPCAAPLRTYTRDMSIVVLSLEALVAFLVNYFRYLPICEALEYLRLANANLLAAVRLIEEDRQTNTFSFASLTTKTALTCAALAAWHPNPEALVRRTYSLVSQMEQVSCLLGMEGGLLSCGAIESISGLLNHRPKLVDLVGVAPPQLLQDKNKQPPIMRTKSLKSILLDKIYGLYLYVLAILPRDDLRRCYHRGILKAGHCYGPMMDAASNIVLNAVWYETMFPPQEELEVAMICSRSLVSVASRSLHGLVAYLCACFSMISKQQAMQYLLWADASLPGAIEMAKREGHAAGNMLSQERVYYKAAATKAQHPNPDALAKFHVETFPSLPHSEHIHLFRLQTGGILDVQLLSQVLMQHCPSSYGSVQDVPILSKRASMIVSSVKQQLKDEESFICRKVNAALKKYTQKTKGPEYELHVICGLNSNVVGSIVYGLHYGPGYLYYKSRAKYSHINFLASPIGPQSSNTVPILFFAECCNKEDVIDEPSCWPVMDHPGRCFYCENEGAKVVHPDLEKYNGRDIDFVQMICDDFRGTTENIISRCENITDDVDICEEDGLYFDANRDVTCAEYLNARARLSESRNTFLH